MRSSRRIRPLSMDQLVERVRREFAALPGLRLTEPQMRRLWSLEPSASIRVLQQLVDGAFLRRTLNGTYERVERDPAASHSSLH